MARELEAQSWESSAAAPVPLDGGDPSAPVLVAPGEQPPALPPLARRGLLLLAACAVPRASPLRLGRPPLRAGKAAARLPALLDSRAGASRTGRFGAWAVARQAAVAAAADSNGNLGTWSGAAVSPAAAGCQGTCCAGLIRARACTSEGSALW